MTVDCRLAAARKCEKRRVMRSETDNGAAGGVLLRALGVTKRYQLGKRAVDVLQEVNLEIGRGEFVALRGASGAGKSTLLHLLGGLDSVDAGQIWFGENDLSRLSPQELARYRNLKVGFIFQAYHLLPELDALENVCLPGRIARRDSEKTRRRGRELLERVGLGHRMDHKPYELSGGEQQRVAVARSLINEPELILADEPTGNLDSHTGSEIIELLCGLRDERQMTLIVATHDSSIAGRTPRVVELLDGRVV